jgi:hypothetical protein
VQPTISKYLGWIFKPFFLWWWTAITGTASILAFLGSPESGISLPKIAVAILIFFFLALIFLTVSVMIQGWSLFWDRYRQLEVISIRKSKDLGSEWIFVISGYLQESQGTLIEICRPLEDTEVPFAIVRIVGKTEKGNYQAVPIWISPGHLRAFSLKEFDARILRAKTTIAYEQVSEAFRGSDE